MPVLGMGGGDLTTDAARPPSLGANLVRTAARMRRSVACRSLETQPSIGGSVRDAARAPSLPDAMSAVLLQPLLAGGVPAFTVTAETALHLMRVDAADGGLARRQTCRVLVLVSAAGPAGAGAMLRERQRAGRRGTAAPKHLRWHVACPQPQPVPQLDKRREASARPRERSLMLSGWYSYICHTAQGVGGVVSHAWPAHELARNPSRQSARRCRCSMPCGALRE